MIVAVASGKGGTGKTTVSASLATVWDAPLVAVDLDVEEPNLHLFLRPEIGLQSRVELEVPVADPQRCTQCRACAELCRYGAVAVMGSSLLVFPEQCHGCGGCLAICPSGALHSGVRELGVLEQGTFGTGRFLMGTLRVGEAMSPPLMRAVKARLSALLAEQPADAVIDAPPGVSCPAVNAVLDADVILLVTEPTPFGFHDFRLAWEAFEPLGKPMAVVINRAGLGTAPVEAFCQDKGLPVLAHIPFDRGVAQGYATGRIVAELSPELRRTFEALRDDLRVLADRAAQAGEAGEVAHG